MPKTELTALDTLGLALNNTLKKLVPTEISVGTFFCDFYFSLEVFLNSDGVLPTSF